MVARVVRGTDTDIRFLAATVAVAVESSRYSRGEERRGEERIGLDWMVGTSDATGDITQTELKFEGTRAETKWNDGTERT